MRKSHPPSPSAPGIGQAAPSGRTADRAAAPPTPAAPSDGSVLFEHLPAAMARIDAGPAGELVIRDANRALRTLVGRGREDLLGAPLDVLVPDQGPLDAVRAAAARYADEPDSVSARCLVAGREPVAVTLAVTVVPDAAGSGATTAPGSPALPSGSSWRTALLAVHAHGEAHADVAERALRESEKRLQDMADNVTALMYLKRLDGRYVFINRHYERVLGIKRELAMGKTDFDLWPPPIASIYRSDDRVIQDARTPMEFEEPIPSAHDGWGMWLSLKFPIFDADGSLYGIGGISTDISERNRADAAVREARDEAERANRAKSEFLSRMSHELRTPLNSILGFGQLLQLEPLAPAATDSVNRIMNAGRHLLAVINEILEISRIEAGKQRFSIETVRVCDPVTEAMELVRPLAGDRQVELARDFHGGLFTCVLADYQRLKQVLLNLLMNAVKYNRPGGLVTVSIATSADRARIRIMDTGLGMDPADIERIFLPFERLAPNPDQPEEGTGLGLALARSMIGLMGGTLGVERTVKGRGSVFYVELPTTREPSPAGAGAASAPSPAAPADPVPDLSGARILYIEDNQANLELIRRILERAGSPRLICTMQGEPGVELATAHQPDLVLLDLHLPDIDGEEVLARLRQDPRTRDTPVVILSADAIPTQQQRLLRAGATGYVTKPFDIPAFLRTIGSILRGEAK
ncbi:ATP-binding protein [Streptomyces sp. NPDC096012]|uniref:PAS domain-containing hybrid sensor histidine kinase/response regulator n=1 Tax=Streptomyces sp. NPDC096012 TaxID=3155684 RepID=UPI00336A928D